MKRWKPMAIRTGSIVSHTCALEWGVGKVLEVTADMARIQFSDGKNRKIVASHFSALQPADAASYTPPPEAAQVVKAIRTPRTVKKMK